LAITGGCLCGAVRYEVRAEAPLGARYCWCRVCQYLGAGTGAVSALFRTEDLDVSGPAHQLRVSSRQRGDHAPAFLRPVRDSCVQRGGRAADTDLCARWNA